MSAIKGTLQYMSPEQARGEVDEIDPRHRVVVLASASVLAALILGLVTTALGFRGCPRRG